MQGRNHYKAWSYKKKKNKKIKAYRQRIRESSCAKKENAIYQNNE